MTLTVFMIVVLLSVVALFWCLKGFSRELKRGRNTVGWFVRVMDADANQAPRNQTAGNKGRVIQMPSPRPQKLQTAPKWEMRVSKA